MSADAAIVVEGVSKKFRLYHERNQSLKAAVMRGGRARYETFQALDDVSVEVEHGETFGFVGENGSGKSTLLKCVARILRPDTGSIAVDGRVSALLELGAGFHPELSGRENVYLNGSILGMSKRALDAKFDEIVEFAGLEQFIDTPVKGYSSGMYVRLGFSVAINVDPDVLLIDEVLAVGDEQFQRKCNEKFAELKQAGKTIVIVSHALSSIRTMCDRAIWLEHGRVKATGAAGAIVDEYIGNVHIDHVATEGGGARWGSGEASIDSIELLGPTGTPTTRVRTGDAVTVRLHYTAPAPIARPVFGIAVHTVAGYLVSGPNSREAGHVPDEIHGSGQVDLVVPRLLLLPGAYDLSCSVTDYSTLHIFDFHQRALRFDVDAGVPHESFGGVVSLDGQWRIDALGGRE